MNVSFSALDKQHASILPELIGAVERVFKSGAFILGQEV